MNEILENFSKNIEELPMVITAFLILISIIFYFFKEPISKRLTVKEQHFREIKKLEHHRFFNVCDKVESRILNMSFITNGCTDYAKTKMMHKLITLKVASMKKHFGKLVTTKGIDKFDDYELQAEFKSCLNTIVNEYCTLAAAWYRNAGIKEEDARSLIEDYEDYRNDVVSAFLDSIDSVLMNPDYISNFSKVNTLMEISCVAIEVIPRDVRSTFEAVNGRYVGYSEVLKTALI